MEVTQRATDAMNATTTTEYAVVQLSPQRWAVVQKSHTDGHRLTEAIAVYSIVNRCNSESEALVVAWRRTRGTW